MAGADRMSDANLTAHAGLIAGAGLMACADLSRPPPPFAERGRARS